MKKFILFHRGSIDGEAIRIAPEVVQKRIAETCGLISGPTSATGSRKDRRPGVHRRARLEQRDRTGDADAEAAVRHNLISLKAFPPASKAAPERFPAGTGPTKFAAFAHSA